jgi:hypothetical protein
MPTPTWALDPPPRDLFDIRHASGKSLVQAISGKDNARAIADGLAARHRTEYGVIDRSSASSSAS